MSSLRRGLLTSGDNFSRQEDIGDQRGELFRQFKNVLSPQISERRNNIVDAAKNSNLFNPIVEGYQQVKPYLPDVNLGEKKIAYDYERPVGPGIFSLGGQYDVDDNEYGLDFGYKWEFDKGGIASLPTPEGMQKSERVPLTDEQKDYLYDYMLDFMFKQRQKEQQEMEGRIPPFNYFDMEV